ncbi:MAG: hypothetical protein SCH39_11335 [Methanosarcinales archaeon]|nr:hypothetical protein [Methanosarcinales archaeon]
MGIISKIIILVETPLNQRDYKRFGIEILQKNGFDIQIWDLTPILSPEDNVVLNDPIKFDKCISFANLEDFKSVASNLDSTDFVICLVAYQLRSFPMYKVLSKRKISYCVTMNNALPSSSDNKPDILYRIKSSTNYQKINYIFLRIPYKWLGIRPARLILAGGTASLTHNAYPIDEKTEILWLHALDYDLYLHELNNSVEVDDKTGVFLDAYLPFHPDFIRSGSPSPTTPDKYYHTICKFFEFIENNFGVHIEIAAHPRSRYEDHPDYFKGRPVIRGKTVELVKRSKFVIAHDSTAVNFAVLFRKPIIFITSNQLNHGLMRLNVEAVASQFGKKSINLDESISINWEKELSIDEDVYLKYENKYIKKTNTQKLPFWQIFVNYIKEHDNL